MEKRSRSVSVRNAMPIPKPTSGNIRQVSSLYTLVPVVREAHVAVDPSSWGVPVLRMLCRRKLIWRRWFEWTPRDANAVGLQLSAMSSGARCLAS